MARSSILEWYAPAYILLPIPDEGSKVENNVLICRSTRNARKRSKTLAFGSDTTRDRAHITCTRNTGRCQGRKRSMRSTRTWRRGTELDLGLSMSVSQPLRVIGLSLM